MSLYFIFVLVLPECIKANKKNKKQQHAFGTDATHNQACVLIFVLSATGTDSLLRQLVKKSVGSFKSSLDTYFTETGSR